MDGQIPDHDEVAAALDRLTLALDRIAKAERPAPPEPLPAPEPVTIVVEPPEPAWARDVAGRLDVLIGELRRALAGEQS